MTLHGFTAYEKAALRVRNVGCARILQGSGFAISQHVLITNRHVIAGADVLQVSTYDGHDINVTLAGAASVADLALVRTEEELTALLPLAAGNPPEDSDVTAVGYPEGGPLTTTKGKVLGYGPDPIAASDLNMLINDAPIEPGSSGSPLVDRDGKIVGVAYAKSTLTDRNYAVPVDVLKQLLNDPAKFLTHVPCE